MEFDRANGHGGYPPLLGAGHYFALRVTLAGQLDATSSYLQNIKRVDERVRELAVPAIARAIEGGAFASGAPVLLDLLQRLRHAWQPAELHALELLPTPFHALAIVAAEFPMVRLSHKFEFSASHRLFNPALSEEENRRIYGKCSHVNGHGHNYELQVTVQGQPDDSGVVIEVPLLERVVAETIIDRFDHRNLNVDLPEFAQRIPSVENIAQVIFDLLKPQFARHSAQLAAVTVWETPKTWCEYRE
jgi:6-pyruvoyltetrahydropterin/6-carboxytetrahydropterin synthase